VSEQVGAIHYDTTIETSGMVRGEREVKRSLGRIANEGDALLAKFTTLAASISAALGSIAVGALLTKLVATQRQFDVMFASLKTMTGSVEAANAQFERLQRFASTTPYSLEQSVVGFTRLKSLGLNPSERAMTSFGNTAAAMGKDLIQMIEAVADASTGEFERLKEFGIKASKEGEKIRVTFQGVTTTLKNDASAIVEYLTKIGENQFAGAMSERMKTLDGDISNLGDSLNELYLSISKAGVGDAVAAGVRKATEAIQEMSISVREGGLTEYFDSLKPILQAAEVAVVALGGAIAGRLVQSLILAATQAYASAAAMGAATVAARAFSVALSAMGGPIGLAITGLAMLALNWDKIGSSARSAAKISEDAADRIAAALKKSPGRATSDLKTFAEEQRQQLREINAEIKAGEVRSIYGERKTIASPEKLGELRQRRDALVKAILDAEKAADGLHGGAGRGRINPENVSPVDKPSGPDKPKKDTFDELAYLAGLAKNAADERERITLAEEEDLRRSKKLLDEKKITHAQHELAVKLIRQAAANDRAAIEERANKQIADLVAEANAKILADEQKVAEDRKRMRESAHEILDNADPVTKLRAELQAKSDLLNEYARKDQENALLYEAAKVQLAKETAAKIKEIEDKKRADQQAAQMLLLQGYGGMFGSMAEMAKAFGGEQSKTYKALFAVSKAFAIAESIIKIQQGVSQMFTTGATLPQKLAGAAAVASAGASVIAAIKSTQFGGGRQYGGPASAGTLYRVNEGGRPEMFTASNGAQYMMPTADGRVTPAGAAGGSVRWSIVVNNNAPGATATASVDDQSRTVTVAIAQIADQIRQNSGPVWSALRSSSNVAPRIS